MPRRFDGPSDDLPVPPARPRPPERPPSGLADIHGVALDYDTVRMRGPAENASSQLDPLTAQVVWDLRAAALAVVTSASISVELQDRMLRQAGIDRKIFLLEDMHFQELVTNSGFPTVDIVYVGTGRDSGLRHALAAGMRAVLVPPDGTRSAAMPRQVHTIGHIVELPGLLARAKAIR